MSIHNCIRITFILTLLFTFRLYSQENYWKDPRGLFPILAYNYPDGVPINPNVFRVMKQGGINIFINCNKSWPADAKKCKDAFEQLKDPDFRWLLILANEKNDDFIFNNSDKINNKKINSYLNQYQGNYIYGTYVWDEPKYYKSSNFLAKWFSNDDLDDINTITKQIKKNSNFKDKLEYVNLYPLYWDGLDDSSDYKDYIDTFISAQENKPKLLSSDIYPLLKKEAGGFRNNYFLNLEILRKKSIEYNIPLWVLVLASGHDHYLNPTVEQIRMQVYCALAYGAKGIGYYLYSKSWEKVGYKSFILEKNFDKPALPDDQYGSRYGGIKKLNNELQIIGKYLVQQKPLAIYHSDLYPNSQSGLDNSLLGKNKKFVIQNVHGNSDSRALISLFNNLRNKTEQIEYIMIVNKDTASTKNYKFILNGQADIKEIDKLNGELISLGNEINSFNCLLLPGEGKLYKVDDFKINK